MKAKNDDASPVKALIEDIGTFRDLLRSTLDGIASRVDKDLAAVIAKAEGLGDPESIPNSRIHEIRDMLSLLRNADVKPEKGRKKDLKKLEIIKDDLLMLSEKW